MYLDKIEIHGFKSFGDSVKLSIPKGITAVIGPNGSGKSNVADAIRWVLGEQSAKTLRGTKMEDIIFAGTERRKSLGYAEVSMHIKNDDHRLPIDYENVVIKRRVYRSGESEYFINGSTCRLKDIQELFMDTGVGKEGYSIIGQGQIDKVLSSKPEDRRSLFEEAAGIYKYKVRRLEAERKLEKERENLLRIHDIMTEIESRLMPLEGEAKKTKSYLSLKDELKDIDINLYIEEVERIQNDLSKVKENITIVTEQMQDAQKHKDEQVVMQTQTKEKRETLFKSIQGILARISELEKNQQQKQNEIQLNEERISSIHQLMEQIEKDTKKQEDFKVNMQNELHMLNAKRTALELEEKTKKELLSKKENSFLGAKETLENKEKDLETSKAEVYDKVRKIDWFKSEIDKQNSLDEQMDYRYSQLSEAIQTLNSDITHQEVHLQVQKKKLGDLQTKMVEDEKVFETLQEKKIHLEKEAESINKTYQETVQSEEQMKRQVGWLEQVKNDFEGYYHSVKQVLHIKKENSLQWKGIVGITADLIEVPKVYEIAIVTALGGGMQNIVAETEADAKQMIQVMKKRNIAKVTFLPLDTIQSYSKPQDLEALRKEQGFLGLASELVTYDQHYEPAVANLLGRILVVQDMETGSRIARKYQYRYKIVTLEGEVFHAGGSLSGGASKNNKNNIFARSRELKELKEKIVSIGATIQNLKLALEENATTYKEIVLEWQLKKDTLLSEQTNEKDILLEINKCESSLKLTKQSQLQLVEEKMNIEEAKEAASEGRGKLLDRIATLKEEISHNQLDVKQLEEELEGLKATGEALRNALTEDKIALSTVTQNKVHVEEQIKNVEHNLLNTKEQHQSIVERKTSLKEDIIKLNQTIEKAKIDIEELEEAILEARATKEHYEKDREALEETSVGIDESLERINDQMVHLKEEHFRITNRKEMLEQEDRKQTDMIWDLYELTYSACLPFKKEMGSISEMKKQADRLRAQIKAIGHVNVNAIQEYEETKTRFEFLSTQRSDIERAEKALMELIDQLTVQMHEIFRTQFAIIAENFSEVFKELFGGGMAFLQLVDEDNILESGIEIIAKPPGKKLQNMTLLSGGERTLTAIALLFGILKMKPSPFCVLDEIEAALDDANVLRFAEYLGKLCVDTQFVVITHRKGTMERADTLYGVTMQERGVSTVLSIKLEEANQYLDKKTS